MTVRRPFPQRILIYGVYGAGKSTLALELSRRLGLPWQPVDELTWEPGWKEVPMPVQRDRIAAICRKKSWILDGAYKDWLDLPLASADLVIGLDFSRGLTLRRLLRRTARLISTGEVICNGNRETLGSALSSESIILWHFASYGRKRRRMRRWAADSPGPQVLLFRTPAELDGWLAELSPVSSEGRAPS
ncbi:adenylate kinase [Catellatospora sp. NPDC049133]|uniref:adenylate kinase n=1 Tax=Catellatospora sp. NPDC049133 TaxID=3155499 RepID=UPI0033C1F1D1